MWNNRKPHILLVGKQNSTANLEDTLLISYKIKQTLTILIQLSISRKELKTSQNMYTRMFTKQLDMDVSLIFPVFIGHLHSLAHGLSPSSEPVTAGQILTPSLASL